MLTPTTTISQFKATYYYLEELIEFCKTNNIPYSGLMKIDLETNIIAFLGEQKPTIRLKINIKNWMQDKLALDAEVTLNYKSIKPPIPKPNNLTH
jgi:SAP domain-containing new25